MLSCLVMVDMLTKCKFIFVTNDLAKNFPTSSKDLVAKPSRSAIIYTYTQLAYG